MSGRITIKKILISIVIFGLVIVITGYSGFSEESIGQPSIYV